MKIVHYEDTGFQLGLTVQASLKDNEVLIPMQYAMQQKS